MCHLPKGKEKRLIRKIIILLMCDVALGLFIASIKICGLQNDMCKVTKQEH